MNQIRWLRILVISISYGFFFIYSEAALARISEGMTLEDQIERFWPVRSAATLRILNSRGSIHVKGYPLDQIRVEATRKIRGGGSLFESQALLNATTVELKQGDELLELSARYGVGFDIGEKVQEQFSPEISTDLVVRAPSNLRLEILGRDGEVSISGWNGDIDIRVGAAAVRLQFIKSDLAKIICTDCVMYLKDITSSINLSGGSGTLQLDRIEGESIRASTTSGNIFINSIKGNQTYLTQSGAIQGNSTTGEIQIQSVNGSATLKGLSGSVNGVFGVGTVDLEIKQWRGSQSHYLESESGDINIKLKKQSSIELEAISVSGKVRSDFEYLIDPWAEEYGPVPDQRRTGKLGFGRSFLRIQSKKGNIEIGQMR